MIVSFWMLAFRVLVSLLVHGSKTLASGPHTISRQRTAACGILDPRYQGWTRLGIWNQHRMGFLYQQDCRPGPTHAGGVLVQSRLGLLKMLVILQVRKMNSGRMPNRRGRSFGGELTKAQKKQEASLWQTCWSGKGVAEWDSTPRTTICIARGTTHRAGDTCWIFRRTGPKKQKIGGREKRRR